MMLVTAISKDIAFSSTAFNTIDISNTFLLIGIVSSLVFAFILKHVVLKHKLHASSAPARRWWWKQEGILQECCPKRKARFLKCMKRCERRKAQKEEEAQNETNWTCPFECAFARIHMPAPLPFRKKKKRSKVVKTTLPSTTTPRLAEKKSVDDIHTSTARKQEDQEALKGERGEDVSEMIQDISSSSSDESLTSSDSSSRSTSSRKSKSRRRKRRSSLSSKDKTCTTTTICSTPSLPVSPSTLIDLALMQNWPQLLVNLAANRRSARERDADGLYPLHWAVSSAPPTEIVRALLNAYPNAAKKVDNEGSLPLHFAAHYGGSSVMMDLLLGANPKAIRVQDKFGRSPLYHAVDKSASVDVLRVLATADLNMITTAACRPQKKEGGNKRWDYLTPLYLAWVNFMTDKRSVETCEGKIWDKASLLLDLAYRHRYDLSDEVEVPVVVAAVALDALLPAELAAVMIGGVSSNELLKVDPITGKTPLSLVASSKHTSPHRSAELISLLLDACPRAANELDRDGKTPLANAAESGKSWDLGLAKLVQAAPDAIGFFDTATGLTPSLLLAAASPQNMENDGTGVTPVDPYNLVGAKSMSLRCSFLEQLRKQRRATGAGATGWTPPSKTEQENQHLSSLFQLIRADPSWIVTA